MPQPLSVASAHLHWIVGSTDFCRFTALPSVRWVCRGVYGDMRLWRYDKGFAGVIPSPLLYDGVLYVIKSGGILTAFDPATGELLKAGRVRGALGGYSASPVAAEGKIVIVSAEGKLAVLRAGRDWDVLAVNDLGEGSFATPALSAGRIYVRTDEALYCFGSRGR